jgi:hypothetical protein
LKESSAKNFPQKRRLFCVDFNIFVWATIGRPFYPEGQAPRGIIRKFPFNLPSCGKLHSAYAELHLHRKLHFAKQNFTLTVCPCGHTVKTFRIPVPFC